MSKSKNHKQKHETCGIIEVVNRTTRKITLLNYESKNANTTILPESNKEN